MTAGLSGPRASVNGSGAAPPPRSGDDGPRPVALVAPRRRRRPAVLIAAVMLAAAGGGMAATTVMAAGHRVAVLAVARDVPLGAPVTAADLRVARVAPDPALTPLTSTQRSEVVGRRAAVGLRAGTLLTASMLTDAVAPAAGQALVAVSLKPGELPARPLAAGDRVLAVTGVDTGAAPDASTGAARALTVVVADAGSPASDGTVVVDVLVAQRDVSELARQAAAGRVALVLLPGEGSS